MNKKVMQIRRGTMQAVNVRLLMFFLLLSCSSHKGRYLQIPDSAKGGSYQIFRERSNDGYTKLGGAFYLKESSNQSVDAGASVNGVLINIDSGKFMLDVMPGDFEISGGFIGYKWVVFENLKVQKGDSIYLKFYLEQDNRPLINYEEPN